MPESPVFRTDTRAIAAALALTLGAAVAIQGAEEGDAFSRAAAEAERAAAAFRAADRIARGWAARADRTTRLLPQNLRSPVWTPSNAAADLYPFLALASRFTDRAAFEGRWLQVLHAEARLTSRLGPLPDDYSLEASRFVHDAPDLPRIIFGSSEYVKDGLVPIADLLGPAPWFSRLRDLVDGILERSPVASRFGPLPSDLAEVNGNLLQALPRLACATGDARYLEAAARILQAYCEEVLPASGGLPVHRWDFTRHAPITDTLSLNDHGNEIVGGLVETLLVLGEKRPESAAPLRPAIVRMVDRLLEIGRNEDGMWFSLLRPATGEVLDRATPDTWGYAFTAVYMAYLITGDERYRKAVRRALESLGRPDYESWRGADSIADAIEGAILLVRHEPVPQALAWIDRQFPRLADCIGEDGIVEGWHGDGNVARTALLHAFLKTRGASLHPWREDLRLGAVEERGRLYLHVAAASPWRGILQLDHDRSSNVWHLPRDYPRLNQFPVWFAARSGATYRIAGLGEGRRASGIELQTGLALELGGTQPLALQIAIEEEPPEPPEPPAAGPAASSPPVIGDGGILLEAEDLDGPWRLQTNYPGYSGRGFRVSNASGVAASTLRGRARAAAAGELVVWARGLATPSRDRAFSVEVAAQKLGTVNGSIPAEEHGARTGFVWTRCGVARVEAGDVEVVVHDEGDGFECPDAIFIAPGRDAAPPALAQESAPRLAPPLAAANLTVWLDAQAAAARSRLEGVRTPEDWKRRRAELARDVRRALGLDPEPPRTPLDARLAGTLERPGYRLEKVVFASRPGWLVPASLYLPAGDGAPPPPWPAVLCPVGHWASGKAAPVMQALAAGLARSGIAAFVYDPVGQGEQAATENDHGIAFLAALAGESNMTYMLWDSMRALDYLETRSDIDRSRIGVTGCSGGGLNTLYLAAVEPRIRAAAPVCYVVTFASFLGTRAVHCPCSHVPGLAAMADMSEVAALYAPRPLLVMGANGDPQFTAAGMRDALASIEALYALEPGAPQPRLFLDEGGHDYSRPMREAAYGFFARHLLERGDGASVPEPLPEGWQPESATTLACLPDRGALVAGATYRRAVLDRLAACRTQPPAAIRARLQALIPEPVAVRWRREADPASPDTGLVAGEDGLKHRTLRRGPADAACTVIVLDDAGLTTATPGLLDAIVAPGRAALCIEPPFWDAPGDDMHVAATDGLLLGKPLAGVWAQALIGHAHLERAAGRRVSCAALGPRAAAVALLALSRDEGSLAVLAATSAPASWADLFALRPFPAGAFLTGAGLAGDIPDLLRAASPRQVLWSGSPLRADLPLSVEVRSAPATVQELAAWLAER